jgi:hypothetical protein
MSHPRGTRPRLQDSISKHRQAWLRVGLDPYPELRKQVNMPQVQKLPVAPEKK